MADKATRPQSSFYVDAALFLAVCTVGIFIAQPIIKKRLEASSKDRVPNAPISMGTYRRGSATAPVGLVEFADFQCPFCGVFAQQVEPGLIAKYVNAGLLQMAFRQLPLKIHNFAMDAAVMAACAGEQGRFWQFHDALFLSDAWLESGPRSVASDAGVSVEKLGECVARGMPDSVSRDITDAAELSVSGTPSFFIGRLQNDRLMVRARISGAQSMDAFVTTIEAVLAAR
jgi:protein-disulfide isomerase